MRHSAHLTRRLLSELSNPERRVLALRILHGYSCTEVADELGLSLRHVRRMQRGGLQQLSRLLAASTQGQPDSRRPAKSA
ncbi:MAG: sigma factor-like helix-turn-helix DNA-binding protein [Dehalococcoidia bacterium]